MIETITICITILIGFIISMIFVNKKINKINPFNILNSITHNIARIKDQFNITQSSILESNDENFNKIIKNINETISNNNNNDSQVSTIMPLILIYQSILLTSNETLKEIMSDELVEQIKVIKLTIKKCTEKIVDPIIPSTREFIKIITNSDHNLTNEEIATIVANKLTESNQIKTEMNNIKCFNKIIYNENFQKEAKNKFTEEDDIIDRSRILLDLITKNIE